MRPQKAVAAALVPPSGQELGSGRASALGRSRRWEGAAAGRSAEAGDAGGLRLGGGRPSGQRLRHVWPEPAHRRAPSLPGSLTAGAAARLTESAGVPAPTKLPRWAPNFGPSAVKQDGCEDAGLHARHLAHAGISPK